MQKWSKMTKNCVTLRSVSQEPYIIWLSFMIHMYKMIISLGVFFIFSKFWFSGSLEEWKGKKKAQNGKKFCQFHFISQEPYIIWSWFLVHMCKMMIFPAIFFIFSKFWFLKYDPKLPISVCHAPYFRNCR